MQRKILKKKRHAVRSLPPPELAVLPPVIAHDLPPPELMTITPAIARDWLDRYVDKNRALRANAVKEYTATLLEGRWLVTHQGMGFNVDNVLVDGQHRLHAIVASGVSMTVYVQRGLPRDVFGAIDGGAKRNIKDLYTIAGGRAGNNVVAVAGAMLARGKHNSASGIVIRQAWADFAMKHEELILYVRPYLKQRGVYHAALAAAFCNAILRLDYIPAITDMLTALCDVNLGAPTTPANHLYQYMVFKRQGRAVGRAKRGYATSGAHPPSVVYRMAISAIRAAVEGRTSLTKLQAVMTFDY